MTFPMCVARRLGRSAVRSAASSSSTSSSSSSAGTGAAAAAVPVCAACPRLFHSSAHGRVGSRVGQQGDGAATRVTNGSERLPLGKKGLVAGEARYGRACAISSSRWSSSSSAGGASSPRPMLKPMRSVLYTPGSSRHLYKIRDIACDASLIDLEVGPSIDRILLAVWEGRMRFYTQVLLT